MKSLYEVINIDLANDYTKQRKKEVTTSLNLDGDLHEEVFAVIDGMDIPEDDERHHWINVIAHKAAADLLTLGKVQPENMVVMSSLSEEDFSEAVTIAVKKARVLNDQTVAAEANLNVDTISETIT
jgi:hypothetical protein